MTDPRILLQKILRTANANRLEEAAGDCERLLAAHPEIVDGWRLSGQIHERLRNFDSMLAAAERVVALLPASGPAQLRLVDCLFYCGRSSDALARLHAMEESFGKDLPLQLGIGGYYTRSNLHEDAHRCFQRAVALDERHPAARALLAAASWSRGELDAAEALLSGIVEERPQDFAAWVNLSQLRRWTAAKNHVERLASLLERLRDPAGEAPLCYALFKELDDLGQRERALAYLARGAAAQRRSRSYRVEDDLAFMRSMRAAFPDAAFTAPAENATGQDAIFVMGLPRSGTTLVERILSSHPDVQSLGELSDLHFAVQRLAGPGQASRDQLPARYAAIDFAALGSGYLAAVQAYRSDAPRFIDKTPANFLYTGLIHLAMPAARIVLLRRHPLDSCYAMYRTLFRGGYPFACDLEDLGRYYVEWDRLMQHWREVVPGALLEIAYEDLISDQETVTRRLLEHCGLEWDDRCLQFHRNPAPTSTASASQVRRPLYASSVGRWREAAAALEPLARILRDAGLQTD